MDRFPTHQAQNISPGDITNTNLMVILSKKHVFDALPSGNGGLPARITNFLVGGSVRPASQSDERYTSNLRVAYHVIPEARLSPSPARYDCYRHAFFPRDDITFSMHQEYI
ncbi:MAG TPA: hypothetical protein VEH81_14310 [Ktedonobacteraceae bacterium]|nr:hypothetical protein [Ktedonobacteraceae bacterium]